MALKAKEVAEIIGVSQATLSLVVNNKPGISDKTREKVMEELKKRGFDYLINEEAFAEDGAEAAGNGAGSGGARSTAAAALRAGGTAAGAGGRMLGFVTYRVGGELLGYNSFFPLIVQGIEQEAAREQYNVTYISVERERAEEGIRQIRASGCVGFVIFATELKEADLALFAGLGLPFVILDNYFAGHELNAVKVNNEQGTHVAVAYLARMGHRRIGYLRSGVDINSFEERYRRALDAMEALGCETPERYVYEIGYPVEQAAEGMKRLLESGAELPTAFVGDNDLVIAGAMRAMQAAGYRIPEDMSFVGFDDRPVCEWTAPPLTSVRLHRGHFGGEAVHLLIRMLRGETDLALKIEINPDLIVRESVREIQ